MSNAFTILSRKLNQQEQDRIDYLNKIDRNKRLDKKLNQCMYEEDYEEAQLNELIRQEESLNNHGMHIEILH